MRHTIIWLYLFVFFTIGCKSNVKYDPLEGHTLDTFQTLWEQYHNTGNHDSLIIVTKPFFAQSIIKCDTLAVAYAGTQIAQSYLVLEKKDSVSYYLEQVASYVEKTNDPKIGILFNNVQGGYYLTYALNYPRSLEYFLKGYDYAKQGGSINGMITMLANIVYIFYIRSDKHGLQYAKQAEKLALEPQVDELMRCYAYVSMAQMSYLSGDLKEALRYVQKADYTTKSLGITSITSLIYLVYADIYETLNELEKADYSYRYAVDHLKYTGPGYASLTLLKYGKFNQKQHRTSMAIDMCKQGLDISSKHHNVEFRRELLRTLADLHYQINDKNSALDYYRQYLTHLDSLSNTSIEQDFSNLQLDYQKLEHDIEIQSNNLALLSANRKIILYASALTVIMILAISFIVLYRRKQKMYKTIVMQHQSYMQRINRESAMDCLAEQSQKNESCRELFNMIEKLMKVDKIYHRNDISLEIIAELVDSNRTYVSKAINTFAGISFAAYVNMYRINEAVIVVSNPDSDILFKQLADSLGYNSITVFSKAFTRETGCTPSRYRKEVLAAIRKKVDHS